MSLYQHHPSSIAAALEEVSIAVSGEPSGLFFQIVVVFLGPLHFHTNCRAVGTLLHCRWECKMGQPLWKMVWQCLKTLSSTYTMIQLFPRQHRSERNEFYVHTKTCSRVLTAALVTTARQWKQSKRPSGDGINKLCVHTTEENLAMKRNKLLDSE